MWCEREANSSSHKNIQATIIKQKAMTPVKAEALVREFPLTFEYQRGYPQTLIKATSPLLRDELKVECYLIVIWASTFDKHTYVAVRFLDGEFIKIFSREDVSTSENKLIELVNEDYRNRIANL